VSESVLVNRTIPDRPAPELRYKRRVGLIRALVELWGARAFITTIAERDIRARYKQTLFGVLWVLVAPVGLMIVFTVFVKRVADIDTGPVPYPLYSYVALIPWGYFVASVGNGVTQIRANQSLMAKVACPREVFPLVSMVTAAVDAFVSLGLLFVLFVTNTFMPKPETILVIPALVLMIIFTASLTVALSGIAVHVRDVQNMVPFILQLLLFATPIAYGMDSIPGNARWIYSLANPMAPIIESFRRTVLYGLQPQWGYLGLAAITTTVVGLVGYTTFKRLETTFADVA
jgi:ABC-type polysaccharide/polyol phosphate export permease